MYDHHREPKTNRRSSQQREGQPTVAQRDPNRSGLPDRLKQDMERFSQMDLSDARVHYNCAVPRQFNAPALNCGVDIHIAPAQAHCLPHELSHVVQQRLGIVPTTTQNDQPTQAFMDPEQIRLFRRIRQ